MTSTAPQGAGLRLAPIWRRALAGIVDTSAGALLAGALLASGAIDVSFWFAPVEGLLAAEAFGLRLVQAPHALLRVLVSLALPLGVWHAAWGLTRGGTPGERLSRLAVIRADGSPAGAVRRMFRAAAYVSWGPLLGLPLFFPWISRSQRGLPDLLARTWVVDARCVPLRAVLARRGPSSPTGSRPV